MLPAELLELGRACYFPPFELFFRALHEIVF